MRKYQEDLSPSVTAAVTQTEFAELTWKWSHSSHWVQMTQVWRHFHAISALSMKDMWLYHKGDYFDLLSFSAGNDALLQLCTYNNAVLLFCVCFSKLSRGLWGPVRGKLMEKVIRETYQVIVKKPWGTCQDSLVRRPECQQRVHWEPLQRSPHCFKDVLVWVELRPFSSFPSCALKLCMAMRFLTSLQINLCSGHGGKSSLKYQVGSQLEDLVCRQGWGGQMWRVGKTLRIPSGQSLLKHLPWERSTANP